MANDFDDAALDSAMQQHAASGIAGTQGISPDAAAAGIKYGPQVGLPASVAMRTPADAQSQAEDRQRQQVIGMAPPMARWAASGDPASVAATKDDFPSLARVAGMAGAFNPGSFADIISHAGSAAWSAIQNALQRNPTTQGLKSFGELGDALSDLGASLAIKTPTVPNAAFPGGIDPQFRFQLAKSAIENAALSAVPISGLGAEGQTKSIGEASHPPMPNLTPHMGPDGNWTTTPEGFVADAEGNPVHFADQKAAGQFYSPSNSPGAQTNQIFQTANSAEGNSFHVQQTGVLEPPVADVPDLGVHPGVDAARGVVAEADAKAVSTIQEELAEGKSLARSPEATEQFLEQQTPGATVSLDAQKLWDLANSGDHGEDIWNKLLPTGRAKSALLDALDNGEDHVMPLSQYLTATSGQPWADKVNGIATFRDDGVSVDQAKEETAATNPGPTIAPFDSTKYPDLDPYEKGWIDAHEPDINAAAQRVAKSLYLDPLFKDGQAIGLTKGEFEKYSNNVQNAHQAIYDKLVEKARKAIAQQRKPEWREAYDRNFHGSMTEIMRNQQVKTAYALKYGTEEAALNSAIKENGQPITFYHGTNFPNITTWGGNKYTHRAGISFAQDENFASQWAEGKGHIEEAGKHPVVYVTHVIAPRIADYRNPGDLKKAADWWVNKRRTNLLAEGKTVDENYLNDYRVSVTHDLKKGNWGYWENADMIKANKWDAVRMKESENDSDTKPNIYVMNGDHVIFKFKDHGGIPQKVSLDPSVKKLYPDLAKELPPGIYAEGGLTADEAAAKFGYDSGVDMLKDVAALNAQAKATGSSLKQHILNQANNLAFAKAQEELGWDLSPQSVLSAALDSVTEPAPLDVLSDELKVLANSIAMPFDRDTIEAYAEDRFEAMPTKQALNIKKLQNYVYRGGIKTEKALLKGDPIAAFKSKQNQFIHFVQLREAFKFQKEFARGTRRMARFAANPILANEDQETLNFIRAILSGEGVSVKIGQYETVVSALKGKTLPDFISELTNEGHAPINAPLTGNLKEASVFGWRGIDQMTHSLSVIGRQKATVTAAGEAAQLNDIAAQVKANADAIGRKFTPGEMHKRISETSLPKKGKAGTEAAGHGIGSIVTRPEVVLHWLDQEQYGPLMKYVVGPLQKAKFAEGDLTREFSDSFRNFIKDQPKDWVKSLDQSVDLPELLYGRDTNGTPVQWIQTRSQAIMAALHLGTRSSVKKLTEGYGWNEDTVRSALNRVLTKEDWNYVQYLLDLNEKVLWPKVEAMGREVRGLAPKKEKAITISTPHGDYAGGYFHILYDRSAIGQFVDEEGNEIDAKDPLEMSADSLFGGDYRPAIPIDGYTKARTNFSAPVNLNHDLLHVGYEQAIHDVTHRPALIQAVKVMKNRVVRSAIHDVLGPDYYDESKNWLQYIARRSVYSGKSANWITNMVRGFRHNFTMVQVGFNILTVLKHSLIAGSHLTGEVGIPALAQSTADMFKSPAEHDRLLKFVTDNSGEVRNVVLNADRDIRETILKTVAKQGYVTNMQHMAFSMFGFMKRAESARLWLAKYRTEMGNVVDHERAVFLADKSVRDTQGAGAPVDLPTLWRGGDTFWGEVGKLSNVFTGFENTATNRGWTMIRRNDRMVKGFKTGDWQGGRRDFNKQLSDSLAFFLVPIALVTALATPKKGKVAQQAAENAVKTLINPIPFGGSLGNVLVDKFFHDKREDSSPQTEAMQAMYDSGQGAEALASGHPTKVPPHWVQHSIDTAGYMTGYPVKPASRAGQYLWDWEHNQVGRKSPGEFARGLLFGPKPKGQR